MMAPVPEKTIATNEVHLGPNLSHNIPAGKAKVTPKFDKDPMRSTGNTIGYKNVFLKRSRKSF